MIKINLNQYAEVVLTAHGCAVWMLSPYSGTEQLATDGTLRAPLWILANVFGPHLFNGCDMPFANADVQLQPL